MRLDTRAAAIAAGLAMGCGQVDSPKTSRVARVQAKSGEVWGRDLAQGLGLQPWELCQELGEVDCLSEAHLITLGGVEPEVLGIDEPLANAAVSAPIAVDRVASSACGLRFDRDAEDPGSAVVFGPVLQGDVKSNDDRLVVSRQLVERLLSRRPSSRELSALIDLVDVLAPISQDLRRDWGVGACVVVATSTEALFY